MNTSELMVGNWVMTTIQNFRNHPIKIVGIEREFFSIADNVVEMRIRPHQIEPIPITVELLEANGFKKFKFHDIEGQHKWQWWLDTLTSVSLWCRELNDDNKDGWMIRVESRDASCCCKIESIHELQHTLQLFKIDKGITIKTEE